MNFKKIAAAFLVMGAALCSAAEVYDLSRVEDWGKRSPLKVHGNGILRATGRVSLFSAKIYPYDAKKTYTFKGMYRQLPGSDSNIFRVGFLPLDKDKKVIEYYTSHPNVTTETVLAKAAAATDNFIIVKNGKKWNKRNLIAYNTKPDRSDLPNKNIIRQVPKNIEQTAEGWKITFAKPIGVAIPAGTGVRQHYQGGRFRFVGNGTGGQVLSNMKFRMMDPGMKYFQVVVVSGTGGIKPGEQIPVIEMRKPCIEVTE
ncbi:MAG: hypothetical protein E7040_07655 [Lentisphaerae bacterium]|nr:hypothetical protein [Lentisphaerota bacterium]